jgi:Ca-activated chloride channel family protein
LKRSPRVLSRLRLLALLLPFGALAAAPERSLSISLTNPPSGEPIFGATELRAEVRAGAAPVQKVEFYLDGLRVGVVDKPPYRLLVDAGQENTAHKIEAVAYDASGATATASLRTGAIQSDLQVDVALRQLFVTVDRGDQPVTYLRKEAFEIFDDGQRQGIITFARGDIPFTAVLALDASGSMIGSRLDTALDAARSFARSMKPLDECKLVLFADRVLQETPFTGSPAILTLGMENIQAKGGTAINDTAYLALKRLEPRTGRKVVILLTDGIDMESVLSMERAQALARTDTVVLYWLQVQEGDYEIPTAFSSWWHTEDEHQRELNLLRKTVLDSGGRIDTVHNVKELPAALSRLLQELRDQYVLGYYPSKTRGSGTWHDLEVRTKDRTLKVRTHRGYVEK